MLKTNKLISNFSVNCVELKPNCLAAEILENKLYMSLGWSCKSEMYTTNKHAHTNPFTSFDTLCERKNLTYRKPDDFLLS